MRTYYLFQAGISPDLRGFAHDPNAESLPAEYGPWTHVQQVGPDEAWPFDISRAVVATGIIDSGFYLWGPADRSAPQHPLIASDRVEGTAVYDRQSNRIGTIKRLLIEKVTGRVIHVDVTFGGFLGVGVHHRTIPWEMLTYDKEIEGYQTEITEAQLRDAPTFYDDLA
jgi:hypothetical protein